MMSDDIGEAINSTRVYMPYYLPALPSNLSNVEKSSRTANESASMAAVCSSILLLPALRRWDVICMVHNPVTLWCAWSGGGMVAMLDGQDGHSGTHLGRLAGGLGGRAAKGENCVQAEGRARPQRKIGRWRVLPCPAAVREPREGNKAGNRVSVAICDRILVLEGGSSIQSSHPVRATFLDF